MATSTLSILINAQDKASGTLDKLHGKAGKLGNVLGTALKAGALAGGAALAGAGVAAVKMGMDFEKSMAEVKTLIPDISEKAFGQMKDDVLALCSEMGIATDKAVPALYQAISAGVPKENVMEFMTVASKAAIGGVTDLKTAVDGLTTVVNAFGYEASETGRVADVMFTGVKLGKTTMEELSTSMFQAAPLAAALSLDIEDVVAATATLTKSGTPTSVAMTQIRQSMVALSKPNKEMIGLLEKTGYVSGEALLQSEGFAGALDILAKAAGGNKEEMAKAFGSVEALQAVLGLTGENAETAAADLATMTTSTGAADEAFKTMADTASFKLNKAINQVKVGMTILGGKVLPVLIKGFEKAITFIQQQVIPVLKDFWQEHGEEIKRFLGDTADLLRSIFVPALDTLRDAWANIAPVLERHVLPVLKKVGQFLLEHKPLLIAIGVAVAALVAPWLAVVAAIALVLAKWDEISQFFTKDIPAAIDSFLTKFKEIPIIGAIFEGAFEEARIIVETVFAIIKNYVETTINAIRDTITIVTALIHGDWEGAWQGIKDLVTGIWDGIKEHIKLVLGGIKDIIWNRISALKGVVKDAWALVETYFREDIPNWFKNNWKDILIGVFAGIPILLMYKFRDKLSGAVTTVAQELLDQGTAIIDHIWEGLKALPGFAVDLMTGFATTLAMSIIAVASDLLQVGKDIIAWIWEGLKGIYDLGVDLVEGLWAGILSMKDWLLDQVSGLAGDILSAIKDGLGDLNPFSPSKFGIKVGKGLGQGIVAGIGATLPDVARAAAGFRPAIGGFTPALTSPALAHPGAAAGIPGGGGGHTTHIHFDGPLLGDQRQLEELADALEPEMRRRFG